MSTFNRVLFCEFVGIGTLFTFSSVQRQGGGSRPLHFCGCGSRPLLRPVDPAGLLHQSGGSRRFVFL